jgi:hypothetical protein
MDAVGKICSENIIAANGVEHKAGVNEGGFKGASGHMHPLFNMKNHAAQWETQYARLRARFQDLGWISEG